MKTQNRAAIFAIVLAIILISVFWFKQGPEAMPKISFTDIDGQTHSTSNYMGKPVLVVFWATDCPGCIEEMPQLKKIYKEYAPKGLQILAVAMPYDSAEQVTAMRSAKQLPYPIVWDKSGKITQAFENVRVTPTHFLIAPDGEIIMRKIGALNMNSFSEKLKKMGLSPA